MHLDDNEDRRLVCQNDHSFDIAREGYVNLLLSGQSRSKTPGYTREMLLARRNLFDTGFFEPLIQALADILHSDSDTASPANVLDAGCGEGQILSRLVQGSSPPDIHGFGTDISKEGIRYAAKLDHSVVWCVSNLQRRLPYGDHTFEFVLNILAPEHAPEFHRVLKPGGALIKAVAMANHLRQFREAIYESGRKEDMSDTKTRAALAEQFEIASTQRLAYAFPMNIESTGNLIDMSPLSWKGSRTKLQALRSAGLQEVMIDLEIIVARATKHS